MTFDFDWLLNGERLRDDIKGGLLIDEIHVEIDKQLILPEGENLLFS